MTWHTYCPNCEEDIDVPEGAALAECVHGCRAKFLVVYRMGERPRLRRVDPIDTDSEERGESG